MPKRIASLSLDLDNKWSYLKTHGDPGWESFPSYLDVVVPRFLSVLNDLQLRITVFVVGQDAALEKNRPALASISAAGHEIGNHSFAHEPWLHRYSAAELDSDLSTAEDALEDATGVRPTGFRGPGYSLSPAVLANLANRGYQFDASTLPTFLGPLARAFYFFTAHLSRKEREERQKLFGNWREGLRPVRPYWWNLSDEQANSLPGAGRLLEIPVTTMPVLRVPIHVSYLLFLAQFSRAVAWAYWRTAMFLCRLTGVGPSLLLHPLDFLGGDDEPDLAFFPAMRMEGAEKVAFVSGILRDFSRRFDVVPMGAHAAALTERDGLAVRQLDWAPQETYPELVTRVSP
jgi:peptidoglycan/xylan/chitin deacetylase (PgdA/CDA1 family)